MNIDVVSPSAPVILSLNGRLDSTTSALLDARLRAFCADGHARIILACEELHYISSAGLRVLMAARKALEQRHGSGIAGIHLAAAKAHVLDIFRLSGLDALFVAHDSVAEAVASGTGS